MAGAGVVSGYAAATFGRGLLTAAIGWALGHPQQVQEAAATATETVLGNEGPGVSALAIRGAYEVAAEGGRHAGFLRNYVGKTSRGLDHGIASIEKEIAKHADKIQNPSKHIEGFERLILANRRHS